jgi:hypothetical protein
VLDKHSSFWRVEGEQFVKKSVSEQWVLSYKSLRRSLVCHA